MGHDSNVPGTNEPIVQPTQEPTFTSFAQGESVLSPLLVEWEPCVHPTVNFIDVGLESDDRTVSVQSQNGRPVHALLEGYRQGGLPPPFGKAGDKGVPAGAGQSRLAQGQPETSAGIEVCTWCLAALGKRRIGCPMLRSQQTLGRHLGRHELPAVGPADVVPLRLRVLVHDPQLIPTSQEHGMPVDRSGPRQPSLRPPGAVAGSSAQVDVIVVEAEAVVRDAHLAAGEHDGAIGVAVDGIALEHAILDQLEHNITLSITLRFPHGTSSLQARQIRALSHPHAAQAWRHNDVC